MSFTAIAHRLLKLRQRRGGGYSSYFGGDVAAIESLAADIMAAAGVTGRAGYMAAVEAAVDALAAAGSVSNSSALYTPFKTASFDAGTVGAIAGGPSGFDVPQDPSVNGVPRYSSDIAGPFGGGKVAKMAWSAADRYFYGGDLFNGSLTVVDGTQLWVRKWLYVVPTFSWGNAGGGDAWGNTKWLRQFFADGGDNCWQMNQNGKCWGMTTEGYSGAGANIALDMSPIPAIPQGRWVAQEFYILFHNNPAQGKIRYRQDGVFLGEATGCTKGAGTKTVNRILHGDYWNGGSPQAQAWYLDEVIMTTQTPDATDSGGRPMIGVSRRVSDFA